MAPIDLQTVVVFDYRGQILENCEFIIAKDEFITIITPKEPTGKIKAIVLHTKRNSEIREPLIASEPCDTIQEAIASLHAKSSEAVQLYITTNGYSEPRDLDEVKDDKLDDDDDDDNDDDDSSSVVSSDSGLSSNAPSVWSATSDTAAEVITPASFSPSRGSRSAPPPLSAPKQAKKGKAANGRSKARKTPTSAAAAAAAPTAASTGHARNPDPGYFTEEEDDDDDDSGPPPRVRIIHHPVRQTAPPPPHLGVAGRHHAPRQQQQQQPPPPPSWAGPGVPPPPPPPFRGGGGGRPMNGYGFVSHPVPPPSMGPHPQYVQTHGVMPPPPPPPPPQQQQQQQPSMIHGASFPGASPGAPPHMGGHGGPLNNNNNMMGPPGANSMSSSSSSFSSSSPSQLQQHQAVLPNPNARVIAPLAPPKHQQLLLHDVRLTITWLHHSSARILETVRPSLRALQDAALAYVRNNPHAFDNVTAADLAALAATATATTATPPPPPPQPQPMRSSGGLTTASGVWALRATVKRAWFGDESWDLASYRGGDDLTRLFASLGGQGAMIPRLEVEVDYPRSP